MSSSAGTFTHEIRVGWADCDPAKIAYTGRIPNFALQAIDAWWEHHTGLDWFAMNIDRNNGTPFVHLSVDFLSPVTPRHKLVCEVRLTKLGNSSVHFEVDGMQDGITCFKGRFVSAFVIADIHKKAGIPADLREKLEPIIHKE